MSTATLDPKTTRQISLRVLSLGNDVNVLATFNGVPYTTEMLIEEAGGKALPGMGVRIGDRGFTLDQDLRPAFLAHLDGDSNDGATATAETDASATDSILDSPSNDRPEELTVVVADNIVAG